MRGPRYRDLLALRRARPELTNLWLDELHIDYDEDARRIVLHRGALRVAVNLAGQAVKLPLTCQILLASASVPPIGEHVVVAAESFAVLESGDGD